MRHPRAIQRIFRCLKISLREARIGSILDLRLRFHPTQAAVAKGPLLLSLANAVIARATPVIPGRFSTRVFRGGPSCRPGSCLFELSCLAEESRSNRVSSRHSREPLGAIAEWSDRKGDCRDDQDEAANCALWTCQGPTTAPLPSHYPMTPGTLPKGSQRSEIAASKIGVL